MTSSSSAAVNPQAPTNSTPNPSPSSTATPAFSAPRVASNAPSAPTSYANATKKSVSRGNAQSAMVQGVDPMKGGARSSTNATGNSADASLSPANSNSTSSAPPQKQKHHSNAQTRASQAQPGMTMPVANGIKLVNGAADHPVPSGTKNKNIQFGAMQSPTSPDSGVTDAARVHSANRGSKTAQSLDSHNDTSSQTPNPSHKSTVISNVNTHTNNQAMPTNVSTVTNAPNTSPPIGESPCPSPIPQPPVMSGGRPPSSLHRAHPGGSHLSFGNFGNANAPNNASNASPIPGNARTPSISQHSPLISGTPPASHLRRGSAHSQQSDLSNGMGRGGFQAGRAGRGGYGPMSYSQQPNMPFSPGNPSMHSFRQQHQVQPHSPMSRTSSGVGPAFHHQHIQQPSQQPSPHPHQSSPSPHAQAQHQQQPHVHHQSGGRSFSAFPGASAGQHHNVGGPVPSGGRMMSGQPGAHMAQVHFAGYQGQPYAYNPQMGPQQMAFMPQQHMDPNFMAHWYHLYGHQQPAPAMGPQSPRHVPHPSHQSTIPPHHYGQHRPPSMSRTSSAVSGSDRPPSSMGKAAVNNATVPTQASSTASARSSHLGASAARATIAQRPKKTVGIVIKDPNSGKVVDLKSAAAAVSANNNGGNASSTTTPVIPTSPTKPQTTPSPPASKKDVAGPPSTKPSADGNDLKAQLARQIKAKEDAAKGKSEVERDTQPESVKPQETDQKAKPQQNREQERERQESHEEISDAVVETESAPAKPDHDVEAEHNLVGAGVDAKTANESPIIAKEIHAIDNSQKSPDPTAIDEDEIARWEAEAAEEERREQEREAAYAKKKQAERDEAARKEAESFQMAEADMRRAEREAEEAENRRLAGERGEESTKSDTSSAAVQSASKDSQLADTSAKANPGLPSSTRASLSASSSPALSQAERKGSASSGKANKPSALVIDAQKSVEPAQPSAALVSLRSARNILHLSDVSYPTGIVPPSPHPSLNKAAPAAGKFIYDRDFLLQFKTVFKEAPTENWESKFKEAVSDGDNASRSGASAGAPRPAHGSGSGSGMNSRQASSRGIPMPTPPGPMGNFQPIGRQGGPSLNRNIGMGAVGMGAGKGVMPGAAMGGFIGRPGGFPQPAGSVSMNRSPSSTSMTQGTSSRNVSQRGTGGSQRGSRTTKREDPKDNKAMPLTAGGNVKPIEVTASGWKPRSVGVGANAGPAPGGDERMAPDVVQRKVKSNLNKMTPNNFDKICGQILAIAHQSKYESDGRSLRQVIQLTFEKATDEAHWAEMYARFCQRMLESMSPEIKDEDIRDKKGDFVVGGALFRKYLLNRCQTEFEQGWKTNLPEKPEGETEEARMLSDEYYIAAAAKRRGLGLVRFIGELYKMQMLTERIMQICVKNLVDYVGMPDEAEIESLTNLLKTIGQQLDATEKGHGFMDACFDRIDGMIALKDLPSRMRFMLMDVVDLRRKYRWKAKGAAAIKGPTTLDEVRAQAAEQERLKEMQRIADSSRRGPGGAGPGLGGRPPMGRGDARNFGPGSMMPPPDYQRNHVDLGDLRRLGSSRNNSRQAGSAGQSPQLGPPSMFAGARGSNRRPLGSSPIGSDSGLSRSVNTPSSIAAKDKKEKDDAAKSGANAFSILASQNPESTDPASPGSSPSLSRAQPATVETTNEPSAAKTTASDLKEQSQD